MGEEYHTSVRQKVTLASAVVTEKVKRHEAPGELFEERRARQSVLLVPLMRFDGGP